MTDWDRVHRAVDEMNERLFTAEAQEDFQAVGLLAREALISLAQAVYDPNTHPCVDDVHPSATDAKRMLEAYVAAVLPGAGNEEARKFTRSVVALAAAVQHRRSAERIDGELCVTAVESVVRLMEILSDREQRKREPWQGVELQGRYFAWSGTGLHALKDGPPMPTPPDLPDAVRAVGMVPSFGLRNRLNHHLAQGGHQVFETDRRRWRRELLLASDGNQVFLVKAERK
jgi:hypothetical protein